MSLARLPVSAFQSLASGNWIGIVVVEGVSRLVHAVQGVDEPLLPSRRGLACCRFNSRIKLRLVATSCCATGSLGASSAACLASTSASA